MYVNDLTLDYGERGRAAVQRLLDEAWAERLIPSRSPSNSAPEAAGPDGPGLGPGNDGASTTRSRR